MQSKLCRNSVHDGFRCVDAAPPWIPAIVSIVMLPVALSLPVRAESPPQAELVKRISTSPDGKVELLTIVPKGGRVESFKEQELEAQRRYGADGHMLYEGLYSKDLRNADGGWQLLDPAEMPYKVKVEWGGDSSWVDLFIGDEHDWGHVFFVRRHDPDTKQWTYQKPEYPDLKRVVAENTAENAAIFAPSTDEQRKDDPGNFAEWKQTPPRDVKPVEENRGRFVLTMDLGAISNTGAFETNGHRYAVTFETFDWIKFDLKSIVRSGSPQFNAYKPDQNKFKPLLMFPVK